MCTYDTKHIYIYITTTSNFGTNVHDIAGNYKHPTQRVQVSKLEVSQLPKLSHPKYDDSTNGNLMIRQIIFIGQAHFEDFLFFIPAGQNQLISDLYPVGKQVFSWT